ncbi:MAG TPA: YCF48-related protein, partial [Pyrinomonadaceae bacterium]|nr:YCF48-related protein [Pyrinomonadaceae bacterium]
MESARRQALIFLLHRISSSRVITSLCLLLLFSTAANAVWTQQQSGTMAWLHAVYFLNERRGWVAGSNGALLETTDGGESWQ